MALPAIFYNGKTIELPEAPQRFQVVTTPPRTVNTTITGVTETIRLPRVDTLVHASWLIRENFDLRLRLENWWQWAQAGNVWAFAMDADEGVNGTLLGNAIAGETNLLVHPPNQPFTVGKHYVIRSGPYQEVVTPFHVQPFVGGFALSLTDSLNFSYMVEAPIRSLFYWTSVLRSAVVRNPFRDLDATQAPSKDRHTEWFEFILEFPEAAENVVVLPGGMPMSPEPPMSPTPPAAGVSALITEGFLFPLDYITTEGLST